MENLMSVDPVDLEDSAAMAIGPARADVSCVPEVSASDYVDAMIDEWGRDSFPASDPPSNW
jgi:hypothetical protein